MKVVETDIHVKTELSCQYFLAMLKGQDAVVAQVSDAVCVAKDGSAVKENRAVQHPDSSFLVVLLTALGQEQRRDGIVVGAADAYRALSIKYHKA